MYKTRRNPYFTRFCCAMSQYRWYEAPHKKSQSLFY